MHTSINDVPVRIEKIAMLENPTDMVQSVFLLTLSKLGISAHISDTGDVSVSKSFLNDLAMEGFIDQEMETFIMVNEVDSIVFIDCIITR